MERAANFQDILVTSLENEKELEKSFNSLLTSLSEELELKPLKTNIHLEESKIHFPIEDIFSIGIRRGMEGEKLHLTISSKYHEFYPFILLREAYYCFLPLKALQIKLIKICINLIVEIKLESHPAIEKWKPLVRKHSVDKESKIYERFSKFFKSNPDTPKNPIKFFFKYVRRNMRIITEETALDDKLFQEYLFKTSRKLYDDEIIETIRILIKIFYRIELFTSLSEYGELFSKFRRNGFIKTDLSLRKFRNNLRWLKKYSYIAPNYKVRYERLNMQAFVLVIQFHPFFASSKAKIQKLLDHFPFLRYIRTHHNGFSLSTVGYIIIPRVYKGDLINFLKVMKAEKYVLNAYLIELSDKENNLNLNYFREFHDRKILINREHPKYDKKYEITKQGDHQNSKDKISPTPFEFLILDRIRYFSISGFGFERDRKILNQLKTDFLNELLSQASTIKNLKESLRTLHEKTQSKQKFLDLLNLYNSSGIFFIKDTVDSIINLSERLEEITEKKNIKSVHGFKKFMEQSEIDFYESTLEDEKIKKVFAKKMLPLFFKHKKRFKKLIKNHNFISNLLSTFFELKIFNLNIIKNIVKNEDIISTLFAGKRKKLSKMHKQYKVEDITIKKIRNIIDSFLETEPPLIQPSLISTITTTSFAGYNLFIILENTSNVQKRIENLKFLFPRCLVTLGKDLMSGNRLIYLDIFMPNLSLSEKKTLFSILQNTFGKHIDQIFRLNSHGIIEAFSLKDYYDFENQCYFYTNDLFSQYKLYMNSILNSSSQITLPKTNSNSTFFKLNNKQLNPDDMARITLKNKSRRNLNFTPQKVHNLEKFHKELYFYLQNLDKFKEITREEFYDLYIQSIKFIPQFQQFGFSKYLFWCKPHDLTSIQLESLLTNTFLNVKTPAESNSISPSFLISYLFPFRTPNTSYINWLLKTKHQFIEYFLVSITQVYHIFQFNQNLTINGWDLKAERFLSYARNLILNNTTEMDRSFTKRYSLETTSDKVYGPHSMEYKSLKDLYTYEPVDLKSFLGRENYSKLDSFNVLNSKDLIFPYLEIKNLGLQEILYIFIPKVGTTTLNTLVDIFSFFNYCFLYEVEGEYLIEGMYETKACQKGVFIELHLPDCAIHEIYNAFYEIFSLLGLADYAIFYDLVDGKKLLKKAFGNIQFLNNYTPLDSLDWNNKDRIWMNVQLIDEKFRFQPIDL